jgi:hypothetical protein
MTTRLVLLLSAAIQTTATAQISPVGPHCAARVCEEVSIYAVALDSVRKRPHAETAGPPRVLRSLYLAPFAALRNHAPVVGQLDTLADLAILRRYWPNAAMVDSATLVAPDGHSLRPGGPLYILSPIDWAGENTVRLQVAEYPRDLNWGAQIFVWLHRGAGGWRVTEVTVGAID